MNRILTSFMVRVILALALSSLSFCAFAQSSSPNFSEREVRVGRGEWAVDGTLTIPAGKGPFPAVLLVPGSGMTDRDMTVGKNKIFRDMASAFARRGIVVLRTEKRLGQHVELFRSRHILPSVKTEFLDDAIDSVKLLRTLPEVESRQIYVLGHSQGGTFASQVANEAGGVAGVIIVSGSTRKPGEMIEEQVAHVLAQPGISEAERKEAATALAGAKQLQHLPADDNQFVLGMPVSYWKYFYDFDAAAEAARLPGRVLVIQSGRDYEVTEKDFSGWQSALSGKKNATLKVYPKLNHLMQEGTGPSVPSEYERLGGPSQQLLSDMADWIARGSE